MSEAAVMKIVGLVIAPDYIVDGGRRSEGCTVRGDNSRRNGGGDGDDQVANFSIHRSDDDAR